MLVPKIFLQTFLSFHHLCRKDLLNADCSTSFLKGYIHNCPTYPYLDNFAELLATKANTAKLPITTYGILK